MVVCNHHCSYNSMGVLFLNDRLLNLAMLIFFASIICNGMLIMLALTPSGGFISDIGLTNTELQYNSMNGYELDNPDGFISNTSQSQDDAGFNPFTVGSLFAGVNAFNFLVLGLFMMETVFFRFSLWFPIFSPIFLSVAAVLVGAKLLLIGYFGSVLLNSILGRR